MILLFIISLFIIFLFKDFDPRVVEQTEQQQPSCIPLSYVLRFFNHAPKIESTKIVQQTNTNVLISPNNVRPILTGKNVIYSTKVNSFSLIIFNTKNSFDFI